jgi:hypothetical protein
MRDPESHSQMHAGRMSDADARREEAGTEVAQQIRTIRGQRVLLDSDLAVLYGVTTKRLNEQVRRNRDRFPSDFLFQITEQELSNLRSQIATSSLGTSVSASAPSVSVQRDCPMIPSKAFWRYVMKLSKPQEPTLLAQDYRIALQRALSWLGDRHLLAQPVNRVSAQPRPNFAETRRWMPGTRR